ncbi:MAG TPA: hypothetical protein LFV90_02880 [Rickettsia endosymbiont of Columbicola hoogstraali]|nr:hypothetical protein [Rickettsia endosymbiont of Columbicola hoogstraali]
MFRKYFSGLFIFLILSAAMYGTEGILKLKELLDVMPQIANATSSSSSAHPEICSSKVTINGVNYEIRYFSFEDTSKKLPPNMTFKEYVEKNNLLDIKSSHSNPLPEIDFESCDFHSVNLGDGVYFSMA